LGKTLIFKGFLPFTHPKTLIFQGFLMVFEAKEAAFYSKVSYPSNKGGHNP
jgi:hypothetical protein